MKFWLFVFLVNPNITDGDNYAGKFAVAYESKAACEAARKTVETEFYVGTKAGQNVFLKIDETKCVSDATKTGKAVD